MAVGLDVTNLTSINEAAETFQADGYLFARWHDPRLAFTSREPGGPVRLYRARDVWVPRLAMVNTVSQRERTDVSVEARPDGTVTYSERFSATLTSPLALYKFPFDRQSLPIVIHSVLEDRGVVALAPDPEHTALVPERWSALAQWTITGLSSSARVVRLAAARHELPEVEFDIHVQRHVGYYLWKVFLPLALLVLISWSIFWIDLENFSGQLSVALTIILTIIAFAFTVSSSLPRASYLTFTDAFFLISYLFVFLSTAEVLAIHRTVVLDRRAVGARIRRTSRWVVPLGYIVCVGAVTAAFLAH